MLDGNPFYRIGQELRFERPRWGVWTTFLWTAGIAFASVWIENFAGSSFALWFEGADAGSASNFEAVEWHGALMGVALAASTPVNLSLIAFAVWLSRVRFKDYLALKLPTARHLLVGLWLTALVLVLNGLIASLAPPEAGSNFLIETYTSASATGPVFLFLFSLALVLLGPLTEEVMFRGFLFRGMVGELGATVTIILTALVWAGLHGQYEIVYLTQIFLLGLVFGFLRWWSGSLYLVIALHVMINSISFVQIVVDPSL